MSKYGSQDITVTLDDSAGVARIITAFILQMGGLKIMNLNQVVTAYGDTWVKKMVTGMRSGAPIQLSGLFDDTALTGTKATLTVTAADAVPGFTRTLTVAIGGGSSYSAEVILAESEIAPKTGGITEFSGTLEPTGTVAIA